MTNSYIRSGTDPYLSQEAYEVTLSQFVAPGLVFLRRTLA
jgi:hypothetical protein